MRREPANLFSRRSGFTLTELLIVIGIIALLISLLIPVIGMVTRQGRRTVTAATLASISSALENYKADFGDYPRFQPDPGGDNPLNTAEDRGARLLARVLMGVAPQDHKLNPTDTDPTPGDPEYLFRDGHGTLDQPFGWKERRQVVTRGGETGVLFPGEVYGPYLDADKFNVRKTTDPDLTGAGYVYGPDAVLLDNNDMPILYYPARLKMPDVSTAPATSDPFTPTGLVADQGYEYSPGALYNAYDNRGDTAGDVPGLTLEDPRTNADHEDHLSLAEMLGDKNQNGFIDEGETAATTGPYLLIASGSDPFRFDPDSGTWYAISPVANFDVAE